MKPFAAICAIFLCCTLAAQDSLSVAMESIRKTESFAFGGVGFAGKTSPGEKEFRVVLSQPVPIASRAFEKLYATANPQGRLYALAGIRRLNPNHFKQLFPSVEDSKEPVETMTGCIVEHRTFGAIAKEIEAGRYDPWTEPRKQD
jgi:hypothetical protein